MILIFLVVTSGCTTQHTAIRKLLGPKNTLRFADTLRFLPQILTYDKGQKITTICNVFSYANGQIEKKKLIRSEEYFANGKIARETNYTQTPVYSYFYDYKDTTLLLRRYISRERPTEVCKYYYNTSKQLDLVEFYKFQLNEYLQEQNRVYLLTHSKLNYVPLTGKFSWVLTATMDYDYDAHGRIKELYYQDNEYGDSYCTSYEYGSNGKVALKKVEDMRGIRYIDTIAHHDSVSQILKTFYDHTGQPAHLNENSLYKRHRTLTTIVVDSLNRVCNEFYILGPYHNGQGTRYFYDHLGRLTREVQYTKSNPEFNTVVYEYIAIDSP